MNKHSQPIFSIIVPIYNVEAYIEQCLNSILAQTFKSFELICVNDGSCDRSIELVQQYDDPRIRIIHQQNRGLAAARNTGINHSRGIFVALLDADDFWLPEKLSTHFKHLQIHKDVDVSFSASQFVDEKGNDMGIGQHPKLDNISPSHIFCRNPVGNGSAAVMRRSFLSRIGRIPETRRSCYFEYFDESLRQSEDVEFWLRAALDSNAKFSGIAEPLSCYRVNASGLSANLDKQFNYWQQGVEKNRIKHPAFFQEWYPLAAAYQQRYLARRAIQSGNGTDALRWLNRSIASEWRVISQEPSKTLLTYAAALCSLLPIQIYERLQKVAINRIGHFA